MRDDFLTVDWVQSHGRTTETVGRFLMMLATGFEKLHRHQFDAPWRHNALRAPSAAAACIDR